MTTEQRILSIKERLAKCESLLFELEKIESPDATRQARPRKRGGWFTRK